MDIDSASIVDVGSRIELSLVGKLFLKRPGSCSVLKNTMRSAWKMDLNTFSVENIGWNFFFSPLFVHQTGIGFILEDLGVFDKSVMVLIKPASLIRPSDLDFTNLSIWVHFYDLPLACMTKAMAIWLGNSLGKFEEADCDEVNLCWGSSLRVRILIDIGKPLRR